MLKCRELAEIGSNYIDGKLPWRRKLSVDAHLVMCKGCRSFIGNLKASTEMMRLHANNDVDETFINSLDERIAEALAEKFPEEKSESLRK